MSRRPDHLILGTRKGLFVFDTDGDDVSLRSVSHRGVPVPYAACDPRSGTLWASLDHGHWGPKLQRSSDLGATWEEVEAPAFPEGSLVREDRPATNKYMWVIAPGGDDEPERLYLGTVPGGLFVSDDGGATWALNDPLWNVPRRQEWFGGGFDDAGIHSIYVDPRDSRRVLVAVSCAGVYETTDGGDSWTPRNKGLRADFLPDPESEVGQDPHIMVACPADPDALWQQNHCGIFRTVDGAATWSEVGEGDNGPAHFGFAVAVADDDPETAWVVPAVSDEMRMAIDGALCVCRTTDGGKSWTPMRAGLPQDNAWDVVYRHALDVRGDTLAFGSTTGNVYMSVNRGDTWATLGSNFPPVYSVRFA